MAIITEDYVSLETAKLLKEKGFDCASKVWYSEYTSQFGGKKYTSIEFDNHNEFNENYKFICSAPTLQIAMKWLREVHKLEVTPFHEVFQGSSWWYLIERNTSLSLITEYEEDAIYGSYEQAAEAGIKYCLENLI